MLKSEVYPIFLLLYLSSTALKLISVNRKVVRKFILYPLVTKWLGFALKFLILISFSSALFLQLERIRNTIHLCGQIHIFIKNVRVNVKFTPKNYMLTYQYLLWFRKPKISSLKCCKNHPKSLIEAKLWHFLWHYVFMVQICTIGTVRVKSGASGQIYSWLIPHSLAQQIITVNKITFPRLYWNIQRKTLSTMLILSEPNFGNQTKL